MKRLLEFLILAFLAVALLRTQTRTITRNVDLRPVPTTSNDPIEKLTQGALVATVTTPMRSQKTFEMTSES